MKNTTTLNPENMYTTETIESGLSRARENNTKSTVNSSTTFIDKCKSVCMCISGCTFVGILLGIIAGGIAYYVFGIKYLIKNHDESVDCNSDISVYVITSLILSFMLATGQAKSTSNEDNSVKACTNLIIGFIWLGIGIWGYITTVKEKCDKIEDTPLYRFSYVISIIQLSIGSLSGCIGCSLFAFVCSNLTNDLGVNKL